MSLKQKALLQTIGIFAVIILSAGLIQLGVRYFDIQTIQYIIGVSVIAFLVYCMYNVVLGRLEYQETLDKLNTKV